MLFVCVKRLVCKVRVIFKAAEIELISFIIHLSKESLT